MQNPDSFLTVLPALNSKTQPEYEIRPKLIGEEIRAVALNIHYLVTVENAARGMRPVKRSDVISSVIPQIINSIFQPDPVLEIPLGEDENEVKQIARLDLSRWASVSEFNEQVDAIRLSGKGSGKPHVAEGMDDLPADDLDKEPELDLDEEQGLLDEESVAQEEPASEEEEDEIARMEREMGIEQEK